jgi:hypothetical protein
VATPLRVVVLGYLVRGPVGGLMWHHLQYVMGLRDLGHDVWFVEDSGPDPWCCYDPSTDTVGPDPTVGLGSVAAAFHAVDLGGRWAYRDRHRHGWVGPAAGCIPAICATADVALDLSGVNAVDGPWTEVPVRVLVDTDPTFTQVRHLTEPARAADAATHTAFATFATAVGRPGCALPDDGLPWQPTRQPVVLDAWTPTPGPAEGAFRTVMQWDSYQAREHAGIRYGMKSDSFPLVESLPSRTAERFELAAGGAPVARLTAAGWSVVDPLVAIPDRLAYQRYLRDSKAELTVAKHGYVVGRTGWFSERSAAFLASGRPVVTQDTGFGCWLDADAGVLAFADGDGALAAVDDVAAHYDRHCRAAREVAEAYFDAGTVLTELPRANCP